MLRGISGRLLTEWMAFFEMEPFGQEWLQAGTVAATVVNMNRDPKKSAAAKPTDFIPGYKEPEPGPDEVAAKVEAYFGALANTPIPPPFPLRESSAGEREPSDVTPDPLSPSSGDIPLNQERIWGEENS